MAKRVKTNYDRGYVNAMDKIRVFIESSSKVMYVDTREYKNAETARCAYRNAIALVRAGGIVRVTCNRNELFLIRNDIRGEMELTRNRRLFFFFFRTQGTGSSTILLKRRISKWTQNCF